MLSGYSGFTDDLDVVPGSSNPAVEEPLLQQQQLLFKSDGLGSGSSGSQDDYTSPRPLVSKPMSPIGPPTAAAFVNVNGTSPKRGR